MIPCRICGTVEKPSCDGLIWRPLSMTCENLEAAITTKYMTEYYTIKGICKKFKVSESRVLRIIKSRGLVRKNIGGRKVPKASVEVVKKILELYATGMSYRATGAVVGMCADKCSAIVKYHEPHLMRTSAQQRDISWKQRPRGPDSFFLSDLDLKQARYPCRQCGVSMVIPMGAKDGMLLVCGLCTNYQFRKQAYLEART